MTVIHIRPKAWAHHFMMVCLALHKVHQYDPVCGGTVSYLDSYNLIPCGLGGGNGDLGK